MAATKTIGLILLILSIPLVLLGLVYLFSTTTLVPELIDGDRDASGYIALGAGGLFLVVGVVLMLVSGKPRAVAVTPVAPVAQQHVEIKRSEMNWGSTAKTKTVAEDLQSQLDAVNQKLSRIKVQYGMGELSNESYRTLTQQYEQEKAAIERKVLDQQGH